MKANQLGVEAPEKEEGQPEGEDSPGNKEGGDTPKNEAGDSGAQDTRDLGNKGEGEEGDVPTDPPAEEGEGEEGDKPEDQSAYNKLMSRWQKEQSANTKLQKENEALKEQIKGSGNQGQDSKPKDENVPYFAQPGWKPKNMEELSKAMLDSAQYGAEMAQKNIELKQESEQKAQQQAKEQVDSFIKEVRSQDKEFDEQAFYDFASRHHFPVKTIEDLASVYSAYADMRTALKEARKETVDNITKRGKNPVNKPGGGGEGGSGLADAKTFHRAANAAELVRTIIKNNPNE